MEVQRHADVGPLAMAHGLAEDTELRGYHLPKDSIVLINIHSVHHEASVWGDPEVFRPERFVGEDGRVNRHGNFVPYSMGRYCCSFRVCESVRACVCVCVRACVCVCVCVCLCVLLFFSIFTAV